MSIGMQIWSCVFAFVISAVLTGLLRRYAISKHIIDIPNERSSHTMPTPRGGGVAIVGSFLVVAVALFFLQQLPSSLMWVFLLGGGGIALLGFLDDHGHIAAKWRLLGHFSAAALALYCLGVPGSINVFGWQITLGTFGYILFSLYIVWLLNLYNFMDGIDGLASIEAITTCLGGAVIYFYLGQSDNLLILGILIFAVAGFLVWNFPPAKIFMGDAGSGFLGFTLAVLSLHATHVDNRLLWSWIILLGVFIVDATYTLLRRLLRGERLYEAHRMHAYQYASRQYHGHRPVTLAIAGINCFWLFPLALCVALGYLDGGLGVVIAFVPLLMLAYKFKAGTRE